MSSAASPSPPHLPDAATLFTIRPGSGAPIWRQLVDQVTRMVAGGQLAAGDTLPSVRETASALAVNPMTVSKAYSALEAAGILERQRGVGMAVAAGHERALPKTERLDALRPALERAAAEARQLEIAAPAALKLFSKVLKETR